MILRSRQDDTIDVSLVVPVFNEEDCLPELIRRCRSVMTEIGGAVELVLVDDGSSDRSRDLILEAAGESDGRITGVLLNRNYGQHAAVIAGFEQARGDVVVTLDADLQNPPEEIPKLLALVDRGHDVVAGVRVPREDSLFRRISSRIVNRAVRKATGVRMKDYGCMLRAYRRPIIDAILSCPEHSTFIPVLANSFARSPAEVEVRHEPRKAGTSRYGFFNLVNLQFDLMTSMTTTPLRMLTILGTIVSAVGVGFGALLLALRILHGPAWAAQGVFTLFAGLFVLVGLQFIGMGLLGEYIGRIYKDVRGRPRFYVERVAGRQTARQDVRA
jgi:undecaprenyl-phosphate 4-deoxy-4-formamido-L-arabinose transferase